MPKTIELAKYAGFCYGVKRAVETAKRLKAENPNTPVSVLGELIHNADVIRELESLGIKTLTSVPAKGEGICIVRTHGESPEVIEKIKQAGFTLVDLTCPDVKKVQERAIEFAKDGYFVVIVGKAEHPEVVAIRANARLWSDKVAVAATVEQLKAFEAEIKAHKKVGVVVQTTQRIATLNGIVSHLLSVAKEVHVANTICASTSKRQNEAREMALNSDLMVVVGSKNSANTTHLAEILNNITKTIHIENASELDMNDENVIKSALISVTAGASTPQNLIDEVVEKLENK